MAEFRYVEPFPIAKEETPYRKVPSDLVSVAPFDGQEVLKVAPEALTLVAREAFRDVSFLYRPGHLAQLAAILDDPEASENDRGVALALLRNAEVASGFVLPMCQDTGTATIVGKKGQRVWTGGRDEEHLSRGIFETYAKENLRYSQTVPLTMYDEANSGTNLPAQIDLYATDGMEYHFLMIAKGGGSANKTFLFQETKALLNPTSLVKYLTEKMKTLGTAACPPYHLAFVIGGTSAEACLKTVKLASAKALDGLPDGRQQAGPGLPRRRARGAAARGRAQDRHRRAVRRQVLRARRAGRPPAAPRGLLPDRDGRLLLGGPEHPREDRPRRHLGGAAREEPRPLHPRALPRRALQAEGRDRPQPADEGDPRRALEAPRGDDGLADRPDRRGPRHRPREAQGAARPRRGPARSTSRTTRSTTRGRPRRREGLPSGSFGPTTAGRMDSYVDLFQSQGGSMVMIAKGNRSAQVTEACRKHGGFYLGSAGGPAALLAKENIRKVELIEYPELGMEAVYRLEVVDFPAVILVDDKGNDFYQQLA